MSYDQRHQSVQNQNNVFLSVGAVENEIPPLLPFMPDRRDQETVLSDWLAPAIRGTTRRPLVCVLHGDHNQAVNEFVDRIRQTFLPDLLTKHSRENSVAPVSVPWPARTLPTAVRLRTLQQGLLEGLRGSGSIDDPAALGRALSSRGESATLVMTSLYSHRWTGAEKDLLGRVMDYWARLPDVRHGAIWVWFVCIIYQRSVAPPFRWLKTRFRIWAEHRIRAAIRAMAKARVGVLFVAPELQSVDRADLDDWVAGCDKRRFDVAGLGPAVRVSFDGFAAAIPMDHVAFKLRALLKDYQKPNDGDRP